MREVSVKEEWTVLAPGPKATTVQPFSSRGTKCPRCRVRNSGGVVDRNLLGGTPYPARLYQAVVSEN